MYGVLNESIDMPMHANLNPETGDLPVTTNEGTGVLVDKDYLLLQVWGCKKQNGNYTGKSYIEEKTVSIRKGEFLMSRDPSLIDSRDTKSFFTTAMGIDTAKYPTGDLWMNSLGFGGIADGNYDISINPSDGQLLLRQGGYLARHVDNIDSGIFKLPNLCHQGLAKVAKDKGWGTSGLYETLAEFPTSAQIDDILTGCETLGFNDEVELYFEYDTYANRGSAVPVWEDPTNPHHMNYWKHTLPIDHENMNKYFVRMRKKQTGSVAKIVEKWAYQLFHKAELVWDEPTKAFISQPRFESYETMTNKLKKELAENYLKVTLRCVSDNPVAFGEDAKFTLFH